MISDIKLPDSQLIKQAHDLVRTASNDMLYNHLMRCYYFAELYARKENSKPDRELIFFSTTMHDLGFTDYGRGPNRFEVESAHAARKYLKEWGETDDRTWKVWTNIAAHTWDINLFKEDEARISQLGILYDVIALPPELSLDPKDVAEIVSRYPRLNFKNGFYEMHKQEMESKQPYPHRFHMCTCIAHEQGHKLEIPDPKAWLAGAPFDE
ncbi:HD domain-containing protein [Mucilaginibacter sp. cycad4]|uniref:HD domain-containing protein n=1 Tax=Mucilaginibacter sp. cycad4 TaxID=3342096 RepID=UPI002AAB71C0|nr:HD domain-containing protein [Mucilaginibacter gossypii]WPU99163.1 HD domain-containing protein [Mucilaginibacter gossypii]